MTSLNVDFVTICCGSMVVPRDRKSPCDDNLAPGMSFQVHREDVVESAEAVPPSENIEFFPNDVSTVGCSGTWKRTLQLNFSAEHLSVILKFLLIAASTGFKFARD